MKHFSLLFIALAGLVMACCTKIEKVDLEEQASDCLWFCKSRHEVLYIDKEHSAFIRESVSWRDEENGEPSAVYSNGGVVTLPYTLKNDSFVFKKGGYLVNGFYFMVSAYEEAWFDALGNLIVERANYIPNGGEYVRDPRPESTWEYIYTRKKLSFLVY